MEKAIDNYLDRIIEGRTDKVQFVRHHLEALPPKLFRATEVLYLDLRINHLPDQPFSLEALTSAPPDPVSSAAFEGWKKLLLLNLGYNKIAKLPTGISSAFFPSLLYLGLSGNPLDLSDDSFDPSQLSEGQVDLLKKISAIELHSLRLESVPKKFFSLCPKLNHIAIRFNSLSSDDLSFLIGAYPNLRKIYLSSNPIVSINPSIANLTNLKKLDISACNLKVIPDEIGNLIHMKKLVAENNFLRHLPHSLINLEHLRKLRLSGNDFDAIPDVLVDFERKRVRLPKLRVLDIRNCDFLLDRQLADTFGLENLTTFFELPRGPHRSHEDPHHHHHSDHHEQPHHLTTPSEDSSSTSSSSSSSSSAPTPSFSSSSAEKEEDKAAAKKEKQCTLIVDVQKPRGPSKILNEFENKKPLFLGNYINAQNHRILDELGVKAILTVGCNMVSIYPYRYTYKVIDILDSEEEDLKQYFEDCIEFIDRERENGAVLVHCAAGVSRSASTVIAYLMKTTGWSFDKTFKYVQKCREIICPNSGFIKQLELFEEELKSSRSGKKKDCIIC